MGSLDIIFRILVAVIFVVLYFTKVVSGAWAIILLVIAGIFAVTSILDFCPLYLPFGISTRKKE